MKASELVSEENLIPAMEDLSKGLLKISSLCKEVISWSQVSDWSIKKCLLPVFAKQLSLYLDKVGLEGEGQTLYKYRFESCLPPLF